MFYGFAYLLMVLVITFVWVFLAIIKKPDFIPVKKTQTHSAVKAAFKKSDENHGIR